mmetsp:Transcript_84960/g.275149  ORF Transcript_84960/g.275149 Transcript_84960/m.275149 type:complete len:217 (+) Transcript_84960:877-1527(+)
MRNLVLQRRRRHLGRRPVPRCSLRLCSRSRCSSWTCRRRHLWDQYWSRWTLGEHIRRSSSHKRNKTCFQHSRRRKGSPRKCHPRCTWGRASWRKNPLRSCSRRWSQRGQLRRSCRRTRSQRCLLSTCSRRTSQRGRLWRMRMSSQLRCGRRSSRRRHRLHRSSHRRTRSRMKRLRPSCSLWSQTRLRLRRSHSRRRNRRTHPWCSRGLGRSQRSHR